MKRVIMLALLVAGALLTVSPVAASAQTTPRGVLDANNLDDDALWKPTYVIYEDQALAQTFTAVNSGTITGVQVSLSKPVVINPEFDLGSFDITAEITEVDSLAVPTDVLASTTIPGSAITSTAPDASLVNITFENPPEVTAGQQYALTLKANVPVENLEDNGFYLLEVTSEPLPVDSYSGGWLRSQRAPFADPPGPWGPRTTADAIFAIYVTLPGPTSKAECKKEGYKDFGFKNQGRCIEEVNRTS